MNIVFICSSVEPSKDGVGDYCRRLAGALIKLGHYAALLSFNDRYINDITATNQHVGDVTIPVKRLPSVLPVAQRLKIAQQWLNTVNPQWLSLQYVPFGFHPKGLPFGLAKAFKVLCADRKLHLMFHELWVGMDVQSSAKYRFWGWLQRRLILDLIKQLKPALIQTQSQLYVLQLARFNIKAEQLPLFGNIPVITDQPVKTAITWLIFGNIHHGAPIEQLAKEAAVYQQKINQPITLVFAGKNGPELQYWVDNWQAVGLNAEVKGHIAEQDISRLLSSATLGICTTPFILADKSGSVAAMLEHQLPVLCVAREWTVHGIKNPPVPKGIVFYKDGGLKEALTALQQQTSLNNNVSDIAAQLIDSLNGQL